jgi:hypothetical protein
VVDRSKQGDYRGLVGGDAVEVTNLISPLGDSARNRFGNYARSQSRFLEFRYWMLLRVLYLSGIDKALIQNR